MSIDQKEETEVFKRDVATSGGYLYTTNPSMSSVLANQRLTKAILEICHVEAKAVLDVGCGDGTATVELYDSGSPGYVGAIDPVIEAIEVGQSKRADRRISFLVGSAYELPFRENYFDVAILRGILHHMKLPVRALAECVRVASTLVVVEPNGWNPVVKMLERISPYHIQHGERSFRSGILDEWTVRSGAKIVHRKWVGLVPFFCPDWLARVAKMIEPLVESTPLIRVCGGQYVFVASKNELKQQSC